MPHNVIIIRNRVDMLKGNATSGIVVDLRANVDLLQDGFENGDVPTSTACHEKLTEMQDWLTGEVYYEKEAPDETITRFNYESQAIVNP